MKKLFLCTRSGVTNVVPARTKLVAHACYNNSMINVFTLTNINTSDVSESFLSSQSHKHFESESSQSHLKIFRVESKSWPGWVESEFSHKNCRVTSSHWFASASQCRVTRNFTFFLRHFFVMKWRPTCYKITPNKLEKVPNMLFIGTR